MRAFFRSFLYAGRGILAALAERNMKIHLVCAGWVVLTGILAELTPERWALALGFCALVLSLELANTALEHACDAVTRRQSEPIRRAKDAAAGAVLVSALLAAVGAVLLFCTGGAWERLWTNFGKAPILWGILYLLPPAGAISLTAIQKKRKGTAR